MDNDYVIRMLVSVAVVVILLTKLDEIMSGDDAYPVLRPMIVSSLLYSAYQSTGLESK